MSQVCPYKDLGNAKDCTIITSLLNAASEGGDKPT